MPDKSIGCQRKSSYGVKIKILYISSNFKFCTYRTQTCKVSDYRIRPSKLRKKFDDVSGNQCTTCHTLTSRWVIYNPLSSPCGFPHTILQERSRQAQFPVILPRHVHTSVLTMFVEMFVLFSFDHDTGIRVPFVLWLSRVRQLSAETRTSSPPLA